MPEQDRTYLAFYGGAGGVTGSKSLLTHGDDQILVDCGMFQGLKEERLRNWAPLGFDVHALSAIVLTHAHLDHSGALPLAVREGYRGPIICTPGTAALLDIMLMDSARLQEEEARFRNERGWSKHKPALPLFTEDDARLALSLLHPIAYNTGFSVGSTSWRFTPAHHILGSAYVYGETEQTSILFSGDVGRGDHLLFGDTPPRPAADTLVCEATYGNRLHPLVEPIDELRDALKPILQRGGTALLPSFAVGRAQELVVLTNMLMRSGDIPDCPLIMDSPMAIRAFEATEEGDELTDEGKKRLAQAAARTRFVSDAAESKTLKDMKGPAVIVSSAGMLTGGRILHHLMYRAGKVNDGLILCGYQAPGTRGRRIANGETAIKIFGQTFDLRIPVSILHSFSAHADQEGLWRFFQEAPLPARAFINHGEPEAVEAFVQLLRERAPGMACLPAERDRRFFLKATTEETTPLR